MSYPILILIGLISYLTGVIFTIISMFSNINVLFVGLLSTIIMLTIECLIAVRRTKK